MSAADPSAVNRTVVIVTLVFLGILIASAFVMAMAFNLKAFTAMFTVFIIAYSSYIFACLWIFRNKLKNDFRYQVALYVTIFTMFFTTCLLILAFVLSPRVPSSTFTTPSQQSTYW